MKQRIQAGQHSSTLEALQFSWRTEGITGIFGGGKLASQILRDVPYAIVTLVTYELLQALLTKVIAKHNEKQLVQNQCIVDSNDGHGKRLPLQIDRKWKDAICGSLAGGLGSFVTTPMDVVKTRMMTGTQFKSIFEAIYVIATKEGLHKFFAGTTPRLLHKIPANGLFFLFYEMFRGIFGAKSE